MIIVIGSEKGGVGKSSLAVNYAYRVATYDKDKLLNVVTVDTDTTSSSTDWYAIRAHVKQMPVLPVVQCLNNPAPAIINLAEAHDSVIVDIGARDYKILGTLALIADLWIIPAKVGQGDLDSTLRMYSALRELDSKHKYGKVPMCVVFSQTPSHWNSAEVEDAREYFKLSNPDMPVLNGHIRERRVWRDAGRLGRSIYEMPARESSKAIEEFEEVFLESLNYCVTNPHS